MSTLAPSGTKAGGCSPSRTSLPIDSRRDYAEWKVLLREARVRDARLHDARHTAATTLLLLGVPDRAVMDVMGWSYSSLVKRYAHLTARLRRDIADRLNAHLWETSGRPNEPWYPCGDVARA